MEGVRLRVTDSDGSVKEWPVDKFSADGADRQPMGFFGAQLPAERHLVFDFKLNAPFEKHVAPPKPGSLDAADEVVGRILNQYDMDTLNVLFARLYDGCSVRIDSARNVVKRLGGKK
jgi:hypothetical protein